MDTDTSSCGTSDQNMFPSFKESRLLVHIAFHYSPGREQFLDRVLSEISRYQFAAVDVVLDTNTGAAADLELPSAGNIKLDFKVHDTLQDPFELTWQHRLAMPGKLQEYEYFMYQEDDMLVPFPALQRWRKDSEALRKHDYLRAFFRTETTAAGELVSTDQKKATVAANYRAVGKQVWYYPENPYHALWLYSREQMHEFMDSWAWIDGNQPGWGQRERAAAGMIWHDPARHRSLLPLDRRGRVHPDAWVQHLPNNYALDPAEEYGSLNLEQLHNPGAAVVLYRRWLGLLSRFARNP